MAYPAAQDVDVGVDEAGYNRAPREVHLSGVGPRHILNIIIVSHRHESAFPYGEGLGSRLVWVYGYDVAVIARSDQESVGPKPCFTSDTWAGIVSR